MTETDRTFYIQLLSEKMGEKRLRHSICVARAAKKLAVRYGANPDDAELAGLLHDITKEMPQDEQRALIMRYGMMTPVEAVLPKVWHQTSGMYYVRYILGIENEGICSAIGCHTTAKPAMTPLEETVYIADFISDDRDYHDVDKVREYAYQGSLTAIRYTLEHCISERIKHKEPVHPDSFAAYNYYHM